jgi:hypothetical protein
MVWEQPFSCFNDKNPYHHLWEFEKLCSCLTIAGMAQETLRWKLFLFFGWESETVVRPYHREGKRRIGWTQGQLLSCVLPYFSYRFPAKNEILDFQQNKKETIPAAWARFFKVNPCWSRLVYSRPRVAATLLVGLSKESALYLDISVGGLFSYKIISIRK